MSQIFQSTELSNQGENTDRRIEVYNEKCDTGVTKVRSYNLILVITGYEVFTCSSDDRINGLNEG